jgi:hypothetical protein
MKLIGVDASGRPRWSDEPVRQAPEPEAWRY